MLSMKWAKGFLVLFTFFFLSAYVLEEAYARVGGGRSFGSRGSRSFTAPRSAPSQTPSSPHYAQPQRPIDRPYRQQPGGFMRSLGGGLAGGLIGGMIGGMLFGGQGHAGTGGFGGGGIGLLDIILIGAILYGIYRLITRRRAQAAPAGVPYRFESAEPIRPTPASPAPSHAAATDDVGTGLDHIRQMDASFDEKKFQDACMDGFFRIQGAWMNRDLAGVKDLLTDEMYDAMRKDVEQLKADKRINRLENIAVRSVDITEAWQEQGNDYITVKFYANLLDYTTDESGNVLEGSKTEPVKFEEYWTFTRPVGAYPWRLSAITQMQ